MLETKYKKGSRLHAEEFNNIVEEINGLTTQLTETNRSVRFLSNYCSRRLVIKIEESDFYRIIFSGGKEFLVNRDLGFDMNDVIAFINGELDVELWITFESISGYHNITFKMSLGNSQIMPFEGNEDKFGNVEIGGEPLAFGIALKYQMSEQASNVDAYVTFALSDNFCTAFIQFP